METKKEVLLGEDLSEELLEDTALEDEELLEDDALEDEEKEDEEALFDEDDDDFVDFDSFEDIDE